MLYYLFRYLSHYGIPGASMWTYISFRSLLSFMFALLISLWCGKIFIKWMCKHKEKVKEKMFSEKVDPLAKEKGFVPSMGGIVIIVAVIIPCLLFGRLRNIYLLLMLVTILWLGITGFIDDYLKIVKTKNGLAPRWKLISQLGLGLAVGLTLYLSPDAVIRENVRYERSGTTTIVHKSKPVKSTITTIPFVKSHNMDYAKVGWWAGDYQQLIGWIVFVLVTVFFIMFASNGANLNDGMDGMCAGNSAIILVTLGVLAYFSSHIGFAAYLNIMYVPGCQELVVFIFAFIGALIGFLWYNIGDAQMYMGDTGSLTIGGVIAVISLIIHKELLLFILCGVFLVELLTSKAQTWYSASGSRHGKARRLFKRAPIHDAFRGKYKFLDGVNYKFKSKLCADLNDGKVVFRFWIITMLLAAFTIITLKIR